MPSFFPSFHLPKTRSKNGAPAVDFETPRDVVHDLDDLMDIQSRVTRQYSVRHMPTMPVYNHKTGQLLDEKRVMSTPHTGRTDTRRFAYQDVPLPELPPPVPKKEKIYSPHGAFRLSSYGPYTLAPLVVQEQLRLLQSDIGQPGDMEDLDEFQSGLSDLPVSYQPLDTAIDCTTISTTLKQSSTFDNATPYDTAPYHSSSTIGSQVYQLADNPSYISSLLHVYLKDDVESVASQSSSVYDEPLTPPPASNEGSFIRATEQTAYKYPSVATNTNPVASHYHSRSMPMNSNSRSESQHMILNQRRIKSESPRSSITKASFANTDFRLDAGADYDKSRFMIPVDQRIQSKRYSSSQIPMSVVQKMLSSSASSSSLDKPKTKPAAWKRWSHVPTKHSSVLERIPAKEETSTLHKSVPHYDVLAKELPKVRAVPQHRHSTDVSSFNYKAKMMQTLQDPNSQKRQSMYVNPSQRAVSNSIMEIKRILRGSEN